MKVYKTIHSAVQDAPRLTYGEYATLTGIGKSSVSSALNYLRESGFVKSAMGEKGLLVWESIKPLGVNQVLKAKSHTKKKPALASVKVTQFVRVEYEGTTYELPADVIKVLKGLR